MQIRAWYQHQKRRSLENQGFCRREFIQRTLALGSASLLSNDISVAHAAQNARIRRRILIVGGGFSGLACAHELVSAGYDVKVVEARNRVGGRVLSFDDFVPGQMVEGGGELIGENHPLWWAFAKKFGLFLDPLAANDDLDFPVYLEGRLLTNHQSSQLYEQMDAMLGQLNAQAVSVDPEQPWLSPDADQLDATTVAEWLDAQEGSELLKRMVAIQLASDNAVANNRASLLGMLCAVRGGGGENYWLSSETHRCRGGNQVLAKMLADAIGWRHIQLNRPVVSIRNGSSMKVAFGDGKTEVFDDVVLAIPPTTWQGIQFDPELPAGLAPQMGNAVKYLVRVKERVWETQRRAAEALTDGMISQTWEGSDPRSPASSRAACLVAFSGGPQAERCLQIPSAHRDESYRTALEAVFPSISQALDGGRMMDWPKDTWTQGGYAFPAPGQITKFGLRLRQGLGNLHFVGEHTCYAFVGYMEGALKSGVDLATRFAAQDGIQARE